MHPVQTTFNGTSIPEYSTIYTLQTVPTRDLINQQNYHGGRSVG